MEKKLGDKADDSDLEEMRSFVNVLSVQNASSKGGDAGGGGVAGKEAPPPLVMPQAPSKDSKKIKELIDKLSDIEERVDRNTT